ncbi:MAG TPA: alkaline phosphatase family protein [Chloroflexia bacterium]|nr:alkaline phosphatase family protein [Chloroflexia bacterium]
MINDESLRAVAEAEWHGPFIKPLYDTYCFSQLPGLIQGALSGGSKGNSASALLGPLAGQYDKVILFFVDAFGWRFFEQHRDSYPFLSRFAADGAVTQLTSQFPSTTAAHVTTIHTGLPVGESGVYEWFYYEPALDTMIAPLLFSFAGDTTRNTLQRANVAPSALYPQETFYAGLARRGLRSFVFQHQDYTPSPYGDVVQAGAELRPFKTMPEALVNLEEALLAEKGKAYYYLYFDALDTMAHRYGPESPQVAAEIDAFFTLLERQFQSGVAGKLKKTLFLLTADHGHTATDPARTIYLDKALPALTPMMKTNAIGQPLVPAGSCRDMFLYITEEHLDEAQERLQSHLAGKAEVHRVATLMDEGFFGPRPLSPAFLGRIGNLVILANPGESVWWFEKGKFAQKYRGNHGGLTRAEMEIPLLAQALG